MDGEGFFLGAGHGDGGAWALGRAGIACISWLKSYATAEETLFCICISKFIIIIVIMIIIIVQCCHMVSLWFSSIGKIRDCHLYFAAPLLCSFTRGGSARPSLIKHVITTGTIDTVCPALIIPLWYTHFHLCILPPIIYLPIWIAVLHSKYDF